MTSLNHDVVVDILEHLWILHSTGWDEELRPDAFRRFFIHYALVSRIWTLPAEAYIFRSVHLSWDVHWQSLNSGLIKRGQVLQNCVRVLDITISHSRLGIPMERLEGIIRLVPNLVELRLRVGPEINALAAKATQTSRLKLAFGATVPTLRAIQISFDGPRTKSRVLKQLRELVPFDNLDFITIAWDGQLFDIPKFDPDKWDVRIRDTRSFTEHWPIETNAATMSLNTVQSTSRGGSVPPLIVPTTFRMYSCAVFDGHSPLLSVFAPHLKQVISQTGFRSSSWTGSCDEILTVCPQLERLLILNCYLSNHYEPMAEMYVMEPQDWTVAIPAHDSLQEVSVDRNVPQTRRLRVGELVQTASHIIRFGRTWGGSFDRPRYRKPDVYNFKWPGEAFFDIDGENNPKRPVRRDLRHDVFPRKEIFMVALRQPATGPIFMP